MELGERMALQVFAASDASSAQEEAKRAPCEASGDNTGSWAREYARIAKAEQVLNGIAVLANSKRESAHEAISQVCGSYGSRPGVQ